MNGRLLPSTAMKKAMSSCTHRDGNRFQQLLPEKSALHKEEIVHTHTTGIGLESEDGLPSC